MKIFTKLKEQVALLILGFIAILVAAAMIRAIVVPVAIRVLAEMLSLLYQVNETVDFADLVGLIA